MDFYENFNKGISQYVPLAMKLEDLKKQRSLETGLKLLESGDVGNAAPLIQGGGLNINPETLSQSPVARLKTAQTEEAMRALQAKRNIADIIKKRMAGTPDATGQMIPGQVSPKDYLNILMEHDPESGATMKALTTQTGIETGQEKLKMLIDHYKAMEALGSRNADAKTTLALAAMLRAEKAGQGGKAKVTGNIGINPITGKEEYLMTDGSFSGVAPGKKPSDKNSLKDLLDPDVGGATGERRPLTAFEK